MDYWVVIAHVVVIWVLAVMTPGANVLLTINTALNHDRSLARYSALGVSLAILLWAFFGASGLMVLLTLYPQLFTVMKVVGGCYLVYLGLGQLYRTRKQRTLTQKQRNLLEAGEQFDYQSSPTKLKLTCTAFLTSILNPKTGFFIVSLFSVSVPKDISVAMMLNIMVIMATITLIWHLFLAYSFSHPLAKQAYQKVSAFIDYLTGGLFTILGVKIMVS
ncbi:lysine transporter LysE [Photobacterium sanctipauli]|uniref:Lysine transporter LysE n=1 Tax=Photobacterium sanctipauli TaxID=1342794 RepID=A0A2T3P0M0_9GAMM|nr:LysE family transporter [Photobacterium sanctipauli]PSW22074.1 lysine transporter LysE [Photobacterium sanctipauli]